MVGSQSCLFFCLFDLRLCGYTPFFGETWDELFSKIVNLQYGFGENWEVVSPEAKDFVRRMLQYDTARLNSQQALDHPWLCGEVPDTPLPAAQARLRLKEDPRAATSARTTQQELPVISTPVPANTQGEDVDLFSPSSSDFFLSDVSEPPPSQEGPVDISAQKAADAEAEAQRQLSQTHIHVHRLSDSFL